MNNRHIVAKLTIYKNGKEYGRPLSLKEGSYTLSELYGKFGRLARAGIRTLLYEDLRKAKFSDNDLFDKFEVFMDKRLRTREFDDIEMDFYFNDCECPWCKADETN